VAVGKGDIDLLTSNIYMKWGKGSSYPWKSMIDALVGAFGTDGTYLTEFAPNSKGLNYYSKDESVQTTAVIEMIKYVKASGINRALWYCWKDDGDARFGVVKADGTYRLLWKQALLNSGSEESIDVPTKTTTISLPDTITIITK
jgi:hypothetical protein